MVVVPEFVGQNWLITPAALAVNEHPPANIYQQKWLMVLSGVVAVNLDGRDASQTPLAETVSIMPDVGENPGSGPMQWAIDHYSIPRPAPNSLPGDQAYTTVFALDQPQWAPFASLAAIEPTVGPFPNWAVNDWHPTPFTTATDVLINQRVGNIFTGITVAIAAQFGILQRVAYNIALRGRIAFIRQDLS